MRDGILKDEAFLPVIFEASPEDDWTSLALVRGAPGPGRFSERWITLRRNVPKPAIAGIRKNTFKRLLLNIWTEQNARWIPINTWDKCNEPLPDLAGRTCYAGLDLATTTDIAALVLAFPIGPKVHLLPLLFVPQEGIRKHFRTGSRYGTLEWVRQGEFNRN